MEQMSFLKILSTLSNENIFLISHKSDLNVDKFDSLIRFEKVQNFYKGNNIMFSYMGGKSLHASWISPYIPSNIKTYVEVFGGAMWIYWESNKVPVETNVYNDFNRHLVNVYACGIE